MSLRITWIWYTGRWWVGCYIWYSDEGTGRSRSPPRPLLAVYQSSYCCNIPLLDDFNVPIKGLSYFEVSTVVKLQRCSVTFTVLDHRCSVIVTDHLRVVLTLILRRNGTTASWMRFSESSCTFITSNTNHSKPRLAAHWRVLPPDEFNSTIQEPLPVYSRR